MKGTRLIVPVVRCATFLLACVIVPLLVGQSGPAEVPAAPTAALTDYSIQPGDQLDIKFFYQPELNEELTVRPDGRISLQLANEVQAQGMTVPQLRAELIKVYGTQLVEPEVSVILRATASRVYVDGEVVRPGPVGMRSGLTLLEAIADAGGLRDSARAKQVIVIRRTKGRATSVITADYTKALKAGTEKNIVLQPFDIVFVSRSRIGNVNRWVDLYLRKNIPVNFGLSPIF